MKAKRFRKKTTSRTCMFSEAFLIRTTMIENKSMDRILRFIALDWGLCNKKKLIILMWFNGLLFNWKSQFFYRETIPELGLIKDIDEAKPSLGV